MPLHRRERFLRGACGGDAALLTRLTRLLALAESAHGFLDGPALGAAPPAVATEDAPPPDDEDASIGPYRLGRLLGDGGMGRVYLAERIQGGFRQRVALKLVREGAGARPERFDVEREILATLDHPGIAKLLDGGITPEGRPYMAMEYVEGRDLLTFCDDGRVALEGRLELFVRVCEAVIYAHGHLVVHRDLKPANILVTPDGRPKLLDFGIAKIVQAMPGGDATRTAHLSPGYAAPEQLTGGAVTTATDVYALGVTLFQLLTGRTPWPMGEAPLASVLRRVVEEPAALSSACAGNGPVPAKRLAGDLDAIVAKSLRKDAADRYPDARALADDIQRHLRNEPVEARAGRRTYVFHRFLRRRWLPLSAAAGVFVALVAGLGGVAWEARRAEREAGRATREAERATATKDFLLGIFRASDPRVAQDKPREQITAKELLDVGSGRIDKEFASQPDLQIELLGLAAEIYADLNDDERYQALQKRRVELARRHLGPASPIVIEALLNEADTACARGSFERAEALLAETNLLLKRSGQDDGLLRANWWRVKARWLGGKPDTRAARARALDRAVALYERVAPRSNEFANALGMVGAALADRGELVKANEVLERALAVRESAPVRNEARIAEMRINLARKQEKLGEFAKADLTYQKAEAQVRGSVGENHQTYWAARAYHARMLHMRGERLRADAILEETVGKMPPGGKASMTPVLVRELYAECLVAEGRASVAVPLLETAESVYRERTQNDYDVREVRRKLGDAYDRVGRTAEARERLKASRDEYLAKEPGSTWTLRIRERWGRFLLEHAVAGEPSFAAGEAELRAVAEEVESRPLVEGALAHSGLSRAARARGDVAGALEQSRLALAAFERARGLYDLRVGPYVWLARSSALAAGGDSRAARTFAEKALAASTLYDVPASAAIGDARAAVSAFR